MATVASAAPLHPRPPLKWAGGQTLAGAARAPALAGHERRRLVEPFCGGLAIALGLHAAPGAAERRQPAPHQLLPAPRARGLVISLPMENDAETYYAYRQIFNALLAAGAGHTVEAASLFYYLNRTGLQRPVPVQQPRRIQRAVRQLRPHRVRAGLLGLRPCFSRWEFSSVDFETLRPEARRLRLRRPAVRRAVHAVRPRTGSRGTTRCARPSGSRGIRARSSCRTRRRRASSRSTGSSGSACASCRRRA